MKKYLDKFPLAFIFLIAIAFSIKGLREPDLWWQIRTGEWILEHHQIPKQDVFSYTYDGAPWINVKWGSEVLLALITKASGPECVFLLQALVSCLLVFFLIKIRSLKGGDLNLALPVSLLFALVGIEYRVIGRPEMFSHLFTVVFLFFLLRERKESSNKIFWLVPLQLLWANFHEAFGIGIVLTAIFVAGAWIEFFLSKRKWISIPVGLPKKLSILLLAQIAAVVVNPNGIKLLTQPLNILGQVYENKYTTELFDFRQPDYWQWNVYWVIGTLVIGALGSFVYYRTIKTKTNRFKLFVEQFGPGYLLTLVAFTYLAATAYRNIVFLALVFFPVLALGLDTLFDKILLIQKFAKQVSVAFCLLLFAFYCGIVSNKYYELTNSRDRFGLEVRDSFNPVLAADFVRNNKLQGKCFSDYLTSSYLLWKLQPEFKTFIDLRDLDVFPPGFFNTFAEAVTFPDEFEKQDSMYHFDYVVLYRPQFTALHNYLYNKSRFHLAYLDAVAAVYVKKEINVESLNDRIHAVDFYPALSHISRLMNPWFRYGAADGDVNYEYLYASYYTSVGDFEKAEKHARSSIQSGGESFKSYQGLGEIYYNKALRATDVTEKQNLLSQAGNYYQQSLNEKSDFSPAYLGLGAVYFQLKNFQLALENFEHAIACDKSNLTAYNFAAECCKHFINQNANVGENTQKAIDFYLRSNKLNPDNPTILLNLGFLYFRNNDCANTTKYLSKVVNFEGLNEEQRNSARECLKKCER